MSTRNTPRKPPGLGDPPKQQSLRWPENGYQLPLSPQFPLAKQPNPPHPHQIPYQLQGRGFPPGLAPLGNFADKSNPTPIGDHRLSTSRPFYADLYDAIPELTSRLSPSEAIESIGSILFSTDLVSIFHDTMLVGVDQIKVPQAMHEIAKRRNRDLSQWKTSRGQGSTNFAQLEGSPSPGPEYADGFFQNHTSPTPTAASRVLRSGTVLSRSLTYDPYDKPNFPVNSTVPASGSPSMLAPSKPPGSELHLSQEEYTRPTQQYGRGNNGSDLRSIQENSGSELFNIAGPVSNTVSAVPVPVIHGRPEVLAPKDTSSFPTMESPALKKGVSLDYIRGHLDGTASAWLARASSYPSLPRGNSRTDGKSMNLKVVLGGKGKALIQTLDNEGDVAKNESPLGAETLPKKSLSHPKRRRQTSNEQFPGEKEGTSEIRGYLAWATATSERWAAVEDRFNQNLSLPLRSAKYFIIKSSTELDVYTALKYGIWTSTELGNRRLDKGFRDSHGPVYLFFSVNTSGCFCAVAQMLSTIDFNANTGVWSEKRLKGRFRVKWLLVKDVPNTDIRHLVVENNENKPVTNCRDTQELLPKLGEQFLSLFLAHRSTSSLFQSPAPAFSTLKHYGIPAPPVSINY